MEKLNLEESERLVKRGSKLLDEGKCKDALECFIRAKRASPSSKIVELIRQAEKAGNFKCSYESSADEIGGDSSSDEVEFDGGRGDGARNHARRSSSQSNLKSSDGGSAKNSTADTNANQESSDHRDRTESRASGGGAPRRSSSCPRMDVEYTLEQLEHVRRVLHCESYYEIFYATKETFDETVLTKKYRRLALLLHTDRNRAPAAKEAFQRMGRAYEVLSSPYRRRRYDDGEKDEAEPEQKMVERKAPEAPFSFVRWERVQRLAELYRTKRVIYCRLCAKRINCFNGGGVHVPQVIRHVLVHLNRPVYECLLCDYASKSPPYKHVKDEHKGEKFTEIIDDQWPDYHEEIMQLLIDCFDQDQLI